MLLSVLIKTYNEEQKLAACLDALFLALREWGGDYEIFIADSRSTDNTVEIAKRYAVGVVRLGNSEQRGCGIGVQLGYLHSSGDLVLLLDGDMQLQPGFLAKAVEALAHDDVLAGVAGVLEDTEIHNRFDSHRSNKKPSAESGIQPWLNGGGLYRRSAIDTVGGYAGNLNLLAYEEADLGLRLHSKGWRLLRMAIPYVRHTGHRMTTLRVMQRMWSSGRMAAGGVLLRASLGKPWFFRAVKMFIQPIAMITIWVAVAFTIIPVGLNAAFALPAILTALIGIQAIRRGSLSHSLFSIVLWHMSAIGLLRGLCSTQTSPTRLIDSEVVAPVPTRVSPETDLADRPCAA